MKPFREIGKKLTEFDATRGASMEILDDVLLTVAERNFIKADDNAFLFGLIADQSVSANSAWSLPFKLSVRLGHFDVNKIAALDVQDLAQILAKPPALHRYPATISRYLINAACVLIDKYQGRATNIWRDSISATLLNTKLREFSGLGPKKSALGCTLLIRDFAVKVEDVSKVNIAYDIHIRRVMLRSGLVDNDRIEDVLYAGRQLSPDYPGAMTAPIWIIGKHWCRPANPLCSTCPIADVCKKRVNLGNNIKT